MSFCPHPLYRQPRRRRPPRPWLPRRFATIRSMAGAGHPELIAPDAYEADAANVAGPTNLRIQLDLFYDHRTNPRSYPAWQKFPRGNQPRTLSDRSKQSTFRSPHQKSDGPILSGRVRNQYNSPDEGPDTKLTIRLAQKIVRSGRSTVPNSHQSSTTKNINDGNAPPSAYSYARVRPFHLKIAANGTPTRTPSNIDTTEDIRIAIVM